MEEIWKEIKKLDGKYEVSNFGNIRNTKTKSIRKPSKAGKGYLRINVIVNGKRKYYYIHRLVAEAFIPNPKNLPLVNHKDENKNNNFVDNLEWCDNDYNINYKNHNLKSNISRVLYYLKRDYSEQKELIREVQDIKEKIEGL